MTTTAVRDRLLSYVSGARSAIDVFSLRNGRAAGIIIPRRYVTTTAFAKPGQLPRSGGVAGQRLNDCSVMRATWRDRKAN
jgi:hypothetical protein